MADFVIPKDIKVQGIDMQLVDLELQSYGEARAEYKPIHTTPYDTDSSLTLRFETEEEFNKLLAQAGGEVVKS